MINHQYKIFILLTIFLIFFGLEQAQCLNTQQPTINHMQSKNTTSSSPKSSKKITQTKAIDPQVRNTVLLALELLHVSPSYSLCIDLGMKRCGSKCCERSQNQTILVVHDQETIQECHMPIQQAYQTFRHNQASKQSNNKNTPIEYNQSQLCNMTNRTMCGQTCCLKGGCDPKTISNKTKNLKAEGVKCLTANPQKQQLCKGVGLLWCDGDCCGFNQATHSCFKANHFGVQFIRCPIQATPQIIYVNSSDLEKTISKIKK